MKEEGVVLKHVAIELIDDHPDNPRLVFRDDVIDTIAANLNGDYPQKHAIHVRQIGDRYQMTSGHHRKRAAEKAGLKSVWCWVEALDDEAAFMELVLSNAQGELAPLEIGMHALKAVPLDENGGGRGKKGDLLKYANRLKMDKSTIAEYRRGAMVAAYAIKNCGTSPTVLVSKAQHLAAIHALPTEVWKIMVEAMLKGEGWSVVATKEAVDKIKPFAELLKENAAWSKLFLPLTLITNDVLAGKEFSPQTVARIIKRVESVIDAINEAKIEDEEKQKHIAEFKQWLAENTAADSWDYKKIAQYELALLNHLRTEEVALEELWRHGAWQDHIESLDDESVSALITDPPYGASYQSNRRAEKHKKIDNDTHDEAMQEMQDCFDAFMPKLKPNAHVFCFCNWRNEPDVREIIEGVGLSIKGSLVWVKNNHGSGDLEGAFAPQHERIIHAVKGKPMLFSRPSDVLTAAKEPTNRHPTEKPVPLLRTIIEAATAEGDVVADPFGGVASTIVAAKQSGRCFWGCEIDDGYYKTGVERIVKNTKEESNANGA